MDNAVQDLQYVDNVFREATAEPTGAIYDKYESWSWKNQELLIEELARREIS